MRKEELMKFNQIGLPQRLNLFPVSSSKKKQKLEDAGFKVGKDPSGKWQLSCRTPCT